MNDWIEWEGGSECPVDGDVTVQIKLQYNRIGGTRAAKKFAWGKSIIAYRLINDEPEGSDSLSLRDHFAGLAMQGLATNHESTVFGTCKTAYELADAMLEARKNV